jgi:hypothetical protein
MQNFCGTQRVLPFLPQFSLMDRQLQIRQEVLAVNSRSDELVGTNDEVFLRLFFIVGSVRLVCLYILMQQAYNMVMICVAVMEIFTYRIRVMQS